MDNKKLPILQKFIAMIFGAMILASFVFIGYRIMTKSSYEARELRQTQLLAISAIEAAADRHANMPGLWDRFKDDEFILVIDHKLIQGNWVIKITVRKHKGFVWAESSAESGWNSRSPQKAVYRAKIFDDGHIVYEDPSAAASAKKIRKIKSNDKDNIVPFKFPEELKPIPVRICASVSGYGEDDGSQYIVLKLSGD